MKLFPLYLVAVLLLGAVVLQLVPKPEGTTRPRDLPLKDLLPHSLPGWIVEDREVADTELLQSAIDSILNFDEYVFRSFRRADTEFSVYIAYWEPGKMSYRLVAGHTPDVCWVNAGWSCTDRESGLVKTFHGENLAPAQWRIFQAGSTTQHVLFWHFSGEDLIDYGTGGVPPITAIFTDMLRKGLALRQEQYFIRISSNQPFEQLWFNDGFQAVLASILPLGLDQSSDRLLARAE